MKQLKLILLIILPNLCFSQTFKVTYVCMTNNGEMISKSTTLDSSLKPILNFVLPEKTKIIYEITCTKEYLEIIGRIDSNNTSLSSVEKSSKMIVDLKNHIAYSSDEKKFLKIITNQITNNSKSKSGILNFDSSYSVSFSKNIPSFIQPFLIFSNSKFAISNLKTPKMEFKLIGYKRINKRINFKKLFAKYSKENDIEEINFLR